MLCGLYVVYLLVVIFSSKIRLHYQLKNLASAEERQSLLLKRSVSFVDLVKQQKDGDDMRAKINAAHTEYGKHHKGANGPKGGKNTGLTAVAECDEEEQLGGYGSTYAAHTSPQNIDEVEQGLEPLQYQKIYDKTPPQGHSHLAHPSPQKFAPLIRVPSQDSVLSSVTTSTPTSSAPPLKKKSSTPLTLIDDVDDEEEDGDEDSICNNPISNLLYAILTGPTQLAFEWTIPEAKPKGDKEHLYPISFTISFLYLAFFSMVISAIFSRWTVLTGLGGDFFGLIMVSAAAELPDMIQSIAASKAGYSSMAMACLASQIANILVGFGLSWFVAIFVRGTTIKVPGWRKLTHSATLQLGNVVFFAVITLGFALWYKTSKVHMVPFKAHMLYFMYGLSVVGFAIFAFVLN